MAGYTQKKDDVYGALTWYRELAYYITRREEYERALKYYDQALARAPADRRALMGRTWARSKVCQYQGALNDIAKVLKQDPNDLVSTAYKALYTYLCCEFEDALVLNYRMVPIRKKPDNFTMGVMHCTEAIENGVGVRAGRPLRDYFKIIRRLAWRRSRDGEKPLQPQSKHKKRKKKKNNEAAKKKVAVRDPVVPLVRSMKSVKSISSKNARASTGSSKRRPTATDEIELKIENMDAKSGVSAVTDIPDVIGTEASENLSIMSSLHTINAEDDFVPPGKPFPFRPMQRYTTNIENYMAEKYLNTMYLDKIFLKNLKYNLGVSSPNKDGAQRIHQLSKEGHKVLAYKQELLRTRRPFYFIKYQEAKLSGALKARMEAELKKMQASAENDAEQLLVKIINAINAKQTRTAIETAEKLKIFCDLKPKKVLPFREEYLDEMYRLVSRAFYQTFRLNTKQFEWEQDKRVYHFLGIPRSREPSADSVINQFKGFFVDWKKQVVIYEDRLRKATSSEEMAWLYHELARFNIELKQYELGRVYTRKCISEGREANNIYWVVNALMMLAKINMLQHNRNDAKFELNDALALAKQLEDKTLEDYINKCLVIVDTADFDDFLATKVLEKREKQIIQMMAGEGMKGEVTYLFRKMGAMPATRRMSVMPGIRLDETGEKPTASARKMSILPTGEAEESGPPSVKFGSVSKKGPKQSNASAKGIGFMELIKYHVD